MLIAFYYVVGVGFHSESVFDIVNLYYLYYSHEL